MFADPEKNLRSFSLGSSMVVADLGAGSGFYTIAAARHVPNGKVYAVEIIKDFLPTIRNKAAHAGLTNIEVIWGDVERPSGTGIGEAVCDRVIASNILSQVEDKDSFVKEISRILKNNGEVLYIDWSPGLALATGHNDRTVTKNKALEMFKQHGLEYVSDVAAGSSHYGMILKKVK